MCHRRPLTFLLLILSLGLLACAGTAAAATPGMQHRGAQIDPLWASDSNADLDRELDLLAEMGANTTRVTVGWASLETGGKGQWSRWYLDKLDRLVDGADRRGMKVILTLNDTPCWASSAPESAKQGCSGQWWNRKVQMYPPTNAADYGDAAKYVTARYGAKMAALEVWNEPNLEGDRFLIAPDEPKAYADMLKAAYPKAKQGNANVPVLAGALAWGNTEFVRGIYANGIKGSYDGLSVHPYNESAPASTDNWGGIKWARDLQRAAGDTTPLWITEFGWSTCRQGSGWCASAAAQAQGNAAAFAALARDPGIKAGIVYALRDVGTDPGDSESNFGVVTRSFQRKDSFATIRDQFSRLDEGNTTSPVPATPATPAAPSVPATPAAPAPVSPVAPRPAHGKPAPAADSAPAAPARPVKRPRPGRRIAVSLKRRGGSVSVHGRAPRGSRVELRTIGCRVSAARASGVSQVVVGASGRFARKLGAAKALRGCRVQGTVLGA